MPPIAGPGLKKALAMARSATVRALSLRSVRCAPSDSHWNTPIVSARSIKGALGYLEVVDTVCPAVSEHEVEEERFRVHAGDAGLCQARAAGEIGVHHDQVVRHLDEYVIAVAEVCQIALPEPDAGRDESDLAGLSPGFAIAQTTTPKFEYLMTYVAELDLPQQIDASAATGLLFIEPTLSPC